MIDAKKKYVRSIVHDLGETVRASGLKGREIGLSPEEILHLWKRVMIIMAEGGGKFPTNV